MGSEDTDSDGTPARLSLAEGDVSFWRPGADNWAPAQVNTAMAPGDELYVGHNGHLELQMGGRAFVRAWGDTQLGFVDVNSDLLRFKVTTGHVSVDVRSFDAGRAVHLDAPGGAFTIARPGYYRIDVAAGRTSFSARRGGHATMTLPTGQTAAIGADEAIVIEAGPSPGVQRHAAPEVDVWDRWNEARTESLLNTVSARYVPQQIAGVADLDRHGDWRVVPTYDAVWFPRAVPVGWTPYSTGRWVLDPFYGWTWVDAAPWGWAPFHYGRWVFVGHRWGWAPGPIVVRPIYAPALVAFLGPPRLAGAPFVTWVALGWGEPIVPWWGRPGFIGRPVWRGWGGPRIVNNIVIDRRTIINADRITVYRNQSVRDAVVAVRRDDFTRRRVGDARVDRFDGRALAPSRAPVRIDAEKSGERSTSRPDSSRRDGVATSPAHRGDGAPSERARPPRPAAPAAAIRSDSPTATPVPPLPKPTTPRPVPANESPSAIDRGNAPERARPLDRPNAIDRPRRDEPTNPAERPRTMERPNMTNAPSAPARPAAPERANAPDRATTSDRANTVEPPAASDRRNMPDRPGASTRPNAVNRQSATDSSHGNARASAPHASQPGAVVHPIPPAQRVAPRPHPVFPGRQEASPDNAPGAGRRAVDRESERGRPGVAR